MVARIPEATPRYSGGTEFMMAVMLGEANMPMPRPIKHQDEQERQVGKVGRQGRQQQKTDRY